MYYPPFLSWLVDMLALTRVLYMEFSDVAGQEAEGPL